MFEPKEGEICVAKKSQLCKLNPKSEYNLRKIINSKSTKELATEYLGLKVGDGRICGYDNEDIILGFNDEHGWKSINSKDVILKKYKSYWYDVDDKSKESIIKSLNQR